MLYDPTPLAYNAALRERLARERDAVAALPAVMEDGWDLLRVILDRSRIDGDGRPDLRDLGTRLSDMGGTEAAAARQHLQRVREIYLDTGRGYSRDWNGGEATRGRIEAVQGAVERLLRRSRRVDRVLLSPPLPERLSAPGIRAFLAGSLALPAAELLYPPRYHHSTRTIVLVCSESQTWVVASLEPVLAHELAHAYLPGELHGFLLSRWEDGIDGVAAGLHVEFREVPEFVRGNVLWPGLPPEHLEAFSQAVAEEVLGRQRDPGRKERILEVMEQVDRVEVTLARIRHVRKSLRVLEVIPAKRLRGTLEKKLHYKRQVSGMSASKMQDQVARKRWTHLQALIPQLEREAQLLDAALVRVMGEKA